MTGECLGPGLLLPLQKGDWEEKRGTGYRAAQWTPLQMWGLAVVWSSAVDDLLLLLLSFVGSMVVVV